MQDQLKKETNMTKYETLLQQQQKNWAMSILSNLNIFGYSYSIYLYKFNVYLIVLTY